MMKSDVAIHEAIGDDAAQTDGVQYRSTKCIALRP